MNDRPIVARTLLRAARFLIPAADHEWLEAMAADLDDAAEDGLATRWAIGCLFAAFRLRLLPAATPATIPLEGASMSHECAARELTPAQETNRRTFMAKAVVALGGTMSVGLVIPLLTSLIPATEAAETQWSLLPPDQWARLRKATDVPIKVTFNVRDTDGYFPAADATHFAWAVKIDEPAMRAARPELFEGATKIAYPFASLGFTLFSPICPHLGGRFAWVESESKFICPLHGSQFSKTGAHSAGPAARGLDPLPLREMHGSTEVTWIEYRGNTPDHIILKIG